MQRLYRWSAVCLLAVLAGCATLSNVALTGTVTEVGSEYGNLDTSITKDAVEDAGIVEGDTIVFACGGPSFTVTYATTYGDVSEGAWVAFINWDNKLRLARNLANAAETSDCALNDAVTVAPAS